MHKENLTKQQAMLKAKDMWNESEIPQGGKAILKAKSMINGSGATAANEPSRIEVLTNILTYFKNGVHNSKPTKSYPESRCLDYTKTEVGSNSGQFHYKLTGDEEAIKDYVSCGLLLD